MKTLYAIGGAMGVGKTTVCRLLKHELKNCVFLDGDWCWDAHPFCVTEETKAMVMDNICHLLNNFLHCSAYENILFCWVMHEQQIIDDLVGRLDLSCCRLKAISLVCDEAALQKRLAKDVQTGLRTPDIVERSLSRLPLYSLLNTIKIDTSHKSALAVAKEIAAL